MNGAFYIAATGLDADQRAIDIVANNVANINTSTFKRSEAQFSALVAPASGVSRFSPAFTAGTAQMLGVSAQNSPIDFSEGPLTQTGQPLDIAISGAGFIEVVGADGQTELWRGGSMMVNSDGYLAAPNGQALKQMIAVPAGATSITIGSDGTVQAVTGTSATPTTLGQITLAMPKDMSTVTAQPDGFYAASSDTDLVTATPGDDGAGTLVEGSIEGSNVQLNQEMVNLMLLQRAYSANAEVVQAGDQLMADANGLRR